MILLADQPSRLATARRTLRPRPPFDFARSLRFVGGFTPAGGEQRVEAATLTKAVAVGGRTVVFEVASTGTIEQARLACTLYSDRPIGDALADAAFDRVAYYLGCDDDLAPFYARASTDPPMRALADSAYGLHQVKFITPFENACCAILGQRTPMATMRRRKRALVESLGSLLAVDGSIYRAFPAAETLAGVGIARIYDTVRHERQALALAACAQAFAQVDEGWLRSGPVAHVEAWLRSIPGIGTWSASFVLIRGLGRWEHIPHVERKLLAAAAAVYGLPRRRNTTSGRSWTATNRGAGSGRSTSAPCPWSRRRFARPLSPAEARKCEILRGFPLCAAIRLNHRTHRPIRIIEQDVRV